MRNVAVIALALGLGSALAIAGCAGGDDSSTLPSAGGFGGTGPRMVEPGASNPMAAAPAETGAGGSGGSGGCVICKTGDSEQSCYSGPAGTEGVGECRVGSQKCVNGEWGTCEGEVVPGDEICDGLDNDCDGLADEDMGQETCGQGNCQVTVDTCVAGVPQTCTPGTPNPTETCDGTDDNCDGQIDEGCSCLDGQTQNCYSGPSGTQGVGLCKPGSQTCTNGQWGACNGAVLPKTEVCNNQDDDCDGVKDNGNPEAGQTCTTGQSGVCSAGLTACQNGVKVCMGIVSPSNEVCDGKDNNCNGQTDEGNPGSGLVCSSGLPGPCGPGTTQCQNGGITCKQNVQPTTEQCDTIDNNCNGQVDEGCNCVNGNTQGCYTGGAGTQGVGPCHGGTQTCAAGNWGSCIGQVVPAQTETCANGVDDNCNGQTVTRTAPVRTTSAFRGRHSSRDATSPKATA